MPETLAQLKGYERDCFNSLARATTDTGIRVISKELRETRDKIQQIENRILRTIREGL